MCLNFSNHQLKMDFYKQLGISEARGNHKPNRNTRNKEKGIQTQCYRESSTYKRRKQENKKGTEKDYKNSQKTIDKKAVTTDHKKE